MKQDKKEHIREYLSKVKSSDKELTATRLGKRRLDIKKYLATEMEVIDRLIKKVVG